MDENVAQALEVMDAQWPGYLTAKQVIRARLVAREAEEVVAYAWRKPGMNGWALGHQPPTPNMPDFDKYEVRSLTFITAHLSENSRG